MGGSVAKLGVGIERRAASGCKRDFPGRGAGSLLGADAPPRLRKLSVPGRLTLRPPRGSQSQSRTVRGEGLPRPRTGRRPQGRRPGASAAPSQGSARDTPPPAPDSAAAAEQSHPRLCRGTRLLQPVRRVPRKGPLAAGPCNRLQVRRLSGMDTDPRGRHDGLRAAPQRGQAPPPGPPPAAPEHPARSLTGGRRPPLHGAAPSGSRLPARDRPAPHDLLK